MKWYELKEEIIKDFGENYIEDYFSINWVKIFIDYKFDVLLIDKYKDDIDWLIFVKYNKITKNILDEFEKYLNNYWDTICSYQYLDENIIIRYFEKFNSLSNLVYNQRLSLDIIEMIINSKRYNNSSFFDDLVKCQYLDENIILKYIDMLDNTKLLKYQRITSNLMNILNIKSLDINLINKITKKNYLYKTDIGKDWFLYFVYTISRFNNEIFYSPIYPTHRLLYCNDKCSSIIKVRIFYKNIITRKIIREVDIIKEYYDNIYKR